MDDFNSHSPLWGGSHTNRKGKILEDFIINNDLCLLNDGSKTFLHFGHGTYTATDLTICVPELLLDFSWKTWDDLCGSDHFPLIITSEELGIQQRIPRWQLKKANWYTYKKFNMAPQDFQDPMKRH